MRRRTADQPRLRIDVPRAQAASRFNELSRVTGVPIAAIGYVTASEHAAKVTVLDGIERPSVLSSQGWTHFGE